MASGCFEAHLHILVTEKAKNLHSFFLQCTYKEFAEVRQVKKWLSLLAGFALIISFGMNVSADAGNSHDDQAVLNAAQKFRNGEKEMPHSGHESENKEATAHSHDAGGAEGGSHSHGPVTETPPNMKVLGTFGGINLSFILIGIWNKWSRRKGDEHGNPGKKTARA